MVGGCLLSIISFGRSGRGLSSLSHFVGCSLLSISHLVAGGLLSIFDLGREWLIFISYGREWLIILAWNTWYRKCYISNHKDM